MDMRAMVDRLNELARAYYTLDDPLVSDGEYDALYDELVALERETGTILPDSPTQRVGGEILEEFVKFTHEKPLYSLDKAQSFDELRAWDKRVRGRLTEKEASELSYMVELKFDGLTLVAIYDDGLLTRGVTRGNGTVGEEITAQMRTIRTVPLHIPREGHRVFQGEGLMPYSALKTYNETAAIPLKNPRNGAAGALRNLDTRETARRNLICYFYATLDGPEEFATDGEEKDYMRALGLPVHPHSKICATLDEVMEEILEIEKIRPQLDVMIDGVVVKVNNLPYREKLGYTVKAPRWAIAYKFEAEEATTLLKDVAWNVGRTGKVTPTALLEPVDIGGVTIARATLNNFDDIQRKGVKIGGRVFLRRSNDVIPEILGKADDLGREIEMIEHCPSCGTQLIQRGVHSFCPNTLSCTPQLIARINHYASRDAMDIRGLSEKTIGGLMAAGHLHSIADLYELDPQELLELEGFGQKRTENLLTAIDQSKERPLDQLIYGLGIGQVGKKTARDLALHFDSLEELKGATREELEALDDIGPETSQAIATFFTDPHILSTLEELEAAGVRGKKIKGEEKSQQLAGKTVVITGTLSQSRSHFQELLQAHGAKVTGSVSKNTDFLLAGEKGGSKRDKAEALGIPILSESDLEALLEEAE
ncbi:MAG: NAD-dependent DNA ligase LigA [Tissierellia bacterium]|nr:NAD-dependent DNA ligase LigA [Tissierellia bacterium]